MLTLEEIRVKGLLALRNELGRAGMIRFLQMYSNGSGDYAKERHAWVDNVTFEEIIAQSSLGRKKKKPAAPPSPAQKRPRRAT